ncbi:MAG: ABC transporter permease, partial [Cyclobacteriaceae bacterium]|nr:ABC transporter permease [Cyclobacteriaceae bacterium]
MLKNYLQVALRSVFKQKIYSLINIIGLAIGIASCTLIFMHVEDEYSYDSFHTKADQIYKVVLERSYPDHTTNYGIIPHSFSGVMATDYPEVVQSVRIFGNLNNEIVVSYIDDHGEKKQFEESGFVAADSNFFDFFSIPLLQGDAKSVLTEPQGIVVTQQTAYKYFGHDDPIGKSLKTDIGDFTITGVCENVPENSHLEFDFLSSLATFDFFQTENFTGFSAHTYVELVPETNTGQLMAKFPEMVEKYAAPQIEQNLNTSYSEYIAAGNGYQYTLLPLRDIHLEPVEYEAEFKTGGNKTDVIVFISIAVLILFIACINFMNLAIARSTERAKEVGIRKTLGSFRSQLIGQFLAESVLISLIALGVAIGLVYLILPGFNTMVGKQLYLQIGNSLVLPGLLLFSIVVGILAGIYPAFFLSSFNTVSVLKGGARSGKSGNWLRNGLVIVQFTISISLIVGTLIIKQQLDFVNQKNLGFDRENILIIERANVLETQQEAFIK